ncbi:hypothetical protein H1R20_g3080, partial [Candolleomyces eurysporus]
MKSGQGFGQTQSSVGATEGGLSQPLQHPVHATHSHLPSEWINLAIAHHTRFERTGELDDLKRAIVAYGTSLAEIRTSVGEQDPKDATLFVRPILYFHLGTALTSLCRFTGKVDPVEKGIVALEKAVELGASLNHTSLPYFYSGLGNALFLCFELTKNVEDLKNAVKAFENGIKVTPQSDRSALSVLHSNLGNPLSMLFEQTGEVALLDRSIGAYKTAMDLAPPDDNDAAASYASLARAFTTRFNRMGRPQEIEDAILAGRSAISLTPTGHHQLPDWLTILANALNSRFNLLKGVKDINEAVTLHRRAIELTPLQNVQFSSRSQHLGASLLDRFNHSGDLRDVEQAIISLHKAIDTCPSGHTSLPYIYTNLGNALASRSRRTGELRLSDQAVAAHRMAVDLSPPTSERRSLFYSNLGASLMLRFGQNVKDKGEDLVEAISSIRKAIEISTENDVRGLATRYACLASALATRARHGAGVDGLESIEEALSVHRKIVELVSVTKEEGLGSFLDSQHIQEGDLLMDRYQISKDGRDLNKALESYDKALEAIPQGHPYLPNLHARYAQAMMEQYQVSQNHPSHDNFKETALEHYRLAAQSPSSSPLSRFNAARAWAAFASVVDSHTNAMNAFQTCVDLLPVAAGLDQTLDRRHEMLVRISDLSRQASAFALRCGNPKKAVEWLEASRCLVWGQLNSLRTPLEDLREYDEELAERFARVSRTLEKSGTRKSPWDVGVGDSAELKVAISLQQEAVTHVELAMEYEAILKRIRAQPGFESFLKASSFDVLVKSLPKSGYVVMINVHETRCDAICLSPDNLDPLHVRLPDFSYAKAEELRHRLRGLVDSVSVRMDGEDDGLDGEERTLRPFQRNKSARGRGGDSFVPSILRDLWILVAKPIVDALELSQSPQPQPERKRIWWCLTGPLAFLPIHAAGNYSSTGVKENATLSDFAISTYIPTLKFLAKSSSPPNSLADGTRPLNRFLLISQSQTTGHSPTPGAAKEVESVAKTLESHSIPNLTLSEAGATVATALEEIKTHNWLHFACHAHQDVDKPLNSGFVLNDGGLTLSEIVKLGMKNAEIAYLSACQTSTGDERLSEEAVHLAAGMLAAGFKGVVVTMWSIRDRDAPQVARDFYEWLLENSSKGGIDSSLAAHALDHAVRRLREEVGVSDLDFLSWLPYVYFGM